MTGQAFMFTPMGMIPIAGDGTPLAVVAPVSADEMNPGAVTHREAPIEPQVQRQPVVLAQAQPAPIPLQAAGAPLRPIDVVKAAKARIREIRVELRNKSRLEKELAELERLVLAAKRPLAPVRAIDSARQVR